MTLKEAAYQYWKQGQAVVTFLISKEAKKPLVEWKKWIDGEQTEAEFQDQPWDKANAFGLVCGRKLKNNLYFGALDFDVKNISQEAVANGREVLKECSVTQHDETVSGGEHYNFYSREPIKSNKRFHDSHGLELLGKGNIVIMSPSEGYKKLNDNLPTEKASLNAYFFKLLGEQEPAEVWFERKDLEGKPYRGQNPPCIDALMRGTQEGARREHGIRLASFLLNFRRYQPNTVLKLMQKWNKLNTPAFPKTEVEDIVKWAVKGDYRYGCRDEILQKFCNREQCPIAPKVVVLTKEQRKKAEEILENPNLLDIMLEHGRKRVIGENNALLQNLIEICSGQTIYPISGIISGFSGSGKNESLRAVLPLIPEEWIFKFTTSTPEAVKYIPEEFAGTLIIYEAVGMRSKTATLGLRAVGEGESIETIYPMRDENTGKMTMGRAKTNAKNFITTESNVDIQPDLYRRVLKLSMNHNVVLTRRVMAKQIREARLPDSLRKKLNKYQAPTYPVEDLRNALRIQNWKAEVIVFTPERLLKLLNMATTKEQQVALRTQFKKILWFIRVLALLHQKNRVCFSLGETKYVIANPYDYVKGLEILETTITETITRIGKRAAEVLELFEKIERLDKHEVAKKLKISTVTAARSLKTLFNNGYLSENQTGKPYTYEILQEKAKQLVNLTNESEYEQFYTKELKTFLDSTLSLITPEVYPKKIEIEGLEKTTLTLFRADVKKIRGTTNKIRDKVSSSQEPTVLLETGKEPLISVEKTREKTIKRNSDGVTPFLLQVENQESQDKRILLTPVLEAEPCELCGLYLVKYEFVVDGQPVRRCQHCIDEMKDRGFKFKILKSEMGEK